MLFCSTSYIYRKIKVIIMKTRRNYRIVKPVRFFLFILICIMVIVFAGYSLLGVSKAEASAASTYARVVIQENDNLWDIVESYNPDVDISYQEIIHNIRETNDIDVNDLHPGDVVFIPVY